MAGGSLIWWAMCQSVVSVAGLMIMVPSWAAGSQFDAYGTDMTGLIGDLAKMTFHLGQIPAKVM